LKHRLVVAIDGPSGAGKSTAGRALADKLGYLFLDTGAMYRALGLKALRRGLSLDDATRLTELARVTSIDLVDGGRGVRLDGEDVTGLIRTQEASGAASRLSVHAGVRREMVARQRELGQGGGVVLDGRDIGTAVFPSADVKFYVDAEPSRRASRRAAELKGRGAPADPAVIEREIRERDALDMSRPDSPLTRADDAVYLDTTNLTLDEVLDRMVTVVAAKQATIEG
jgi:cytidylate kinase